MSFFEYVNNWEKFRHLFYFVDSLNCYFRTRSKQCSMKLFPLSVTTFLQIMGLLSPENFGNQSKYEWHYPTANLYCYDSLSTIQ